MADTGVVLVCDDTPSKRYVLCSWLRRAGHTVLEAETGAQALEMVAVHPIDIVLLDVSLPDMSGFEVCELIKGASTTSAVPVIHVSATAVDVAYRAEGLTRGADAYLVEPIDPDEMLATVQAALRYYRARQHAERLATRLAKLASMTVEMNRATTVRAVLTSAATGAAGIFDSPVVICTESDEGTPLSVAIGGPGAMPQFSQDIGDLFPMAVGSVYHDQPAGSWPQIDWQGAEMLRVLGARPRADRDPLYIAIPLNITDAGSPVLTQLAQAIATALISIRAYAQEHQLALTLQRSLLPARLPRVPGWETAVRYVPASAQAEVGGDFYEVSEIGNRLIVAIGDVAGHSLHAATVMAEIRHATRAFLSEGHEPRVVLDRLNSLMLQLIPDETATVCLLEIEPATGAVRFANAGHPPPLLVGADEARYLAHRSPMLGVFGATHSQTSFAMASGEALVIFTDGLIERRDRNIKEGLADLRRAAVRVEDDLGVFCDRLLEDVGMEEPEDDVAVVVVRRASLPL